MLLSRHRLSHITHISCFLGYHISRMLHVSYLLLYLSKVSEGHPTGKHNAETAIQQGVLESQGVSLAMENACSKNTTELWLRCFV